MNDDELDQSLLFETLAASMNLAKREQKSLIESLAIMLSGALPEQVTVTRGGWMLSKEKPVEELLVRFSDTHYHIQKRKNGSGYSSRALKIVRGVTLKTSDLEMDQCLEQIARELSTMAESNQRVRDSLQRFVQG